MFMVTLKGLRIAKIKIHILLAPVQTRGGHNGPVKVIFIFCYAQAL